MRTPNFPTQALGCGILGVSSDLVHLQLAYAYPSKKPECALPDDMPIPDWVTGASGNRRRATVAPAILP